MAATWTGWARQLTGKPHVHHCYLVHGHDVTARPCQREHRSYSTAKACADTAAQRCNRSSTGTDEMGSPCRRCLGQAVPYCTCVLACAAPGCDGWEDA